MDSGEDACLEGERNCSRRYESARSSERWGGRMIGYW